MARLNRRFLSAVMMVLTLVFASIAGAQNIPHLNNRHRVYRVPAGFVPSAIGMRGIERLERELAQLHHPFFVLFVEEIGGRGSSDERATNYLNRAVDTWRTNQPRFFTSESSVLMLSLRPRKWRAMAGSRWAIQLNIRDAEIIGYGERYFSPYVRRRPPDPVTGILTMARAFDAHVFDQTDPATLQHRREERERIVEAARQARIARELSEARRRLMGEVHTAINILNAAASFLPPMRDAHDTAFLEARRMLGRADVTTADVNAARSTLRRENNALQARVTKAKDDWRWNNFLTMIKRITLFALIFGLICFIARRFRQLTELRLRFSDELFGPEKRVAYALERYRAFDDECQHIQGTALPSLTGATKKLYTAVTEEIDQITGIITAMSDRLTQLKGRASEAGFFNFNPLREAIKGISASFDFDTGVIDRRRLFSPLTERMTIDPTKVEQDLAARFATAMTGWDELWTAHNARMSDPRRELPMAHLEAVRTTASNNQIPEHWYSGHPLARDPDAIYAKLLALRRNDPVTYGKRLAALKKSADETRENLDAVAAIVAPIFGTPLNVTLPENTIVDHEDDPRIHIQAAMRGEDDLRGMLVILSPREALATKVEEILAQRRAATEKAAHALFCLEKADEALVAARVDQRVADAIKATIGEHAAKISAVHAGVDNSHLNNGNALVTRGAATLARAETELQKMRHVAARRLALEASRLFTEATEQFAVTKLHYTCLEKAVDEAAEQIRAANVTHGTILRSLDAGRRKVDTACMVHHDVAEARNSLECAATAIEHAERSIREARMSRDTRHYMKATASANEALAQFTEAHNKIKDATRWCAEADRKKAEAEAERDHQERAHRSPETSRRYNGGVW